MALIKEYASNIPVLEHSLQGSILDSNIGMLLSRLRAVCEPCAGSDNVNTDANQFHDRVQLYVLKSTPAAGKVAASGAQVTFRLRYSLRDPSAPWHLQQYGNEMPERSKYCLVRTMFESCVCNSTPQFLHELGFKLESECVAKGYVFTKNRVKIVVSKLLRMGAQGALEAVSAAHLVEVSRVTPQDVHDTHDELRQLADALKPLVQLEKMDTRRLLMAPS